jgi:hypothetical protein
MEVKVFGQRCTIEVIILSILAGMFISCNFICICSDVKTNIESMTSKIGSPYDLKHEDAGNLGNWYSSLESNKQHGVDSSPYDLLFMFKNNKISPKCCPGTYSSSAGCVCITPEQMLYLNKRGLNRSSSNDY